MTNELNRTEVNMTREIEKLAETKEYGGGTDIGNANDIYNAELIDGVYYRKKKWGIVEND